MTNNFSRREGVGRTVILTAGMTLVALWPGSSWPQSEVKPATQELASPGAQARRDFAEERQQAVIKALGGKAAPGFNISAEGPDAAYYVWHASFSMTASICSNQLSERFASQLRELGFTKFVCTDNDKNTFTFDPVAKVNRAPVVEAVHEPTPQGRRDFAEAKRQELFHALGQKYADRGLNISAEGADATQYVWHVTAFSMTESACRGNLTESLASQLRELGFTKFVCTDKERRFAFDPVAQVHPVVLGKEDVPPTPQARAEFAKAREQQATDMGLKKTRISLEGLDATDYVFSSSPISEDVCKHLLTEVAPQLRELGFSKFVCTDDKKERFAFDPVPQLVPPTQGPLPEQSWEKDDYVAKGSFQPATNREIDARPKPAIVVADGASVLSDKRYVRIGTITAEEPAETSDPAVTQRLQATILQKAAKAGGDVVLFSKEGELGTIVVEEKNKGKCVLKGVQTVDFGSYVDRADNNKVKTGPHVAEVCVLRESKFREASGLSSAGTVWRDDSVLAAQLEAARLYEIELERTRDFQVALYATDLAKMGSLLDVDPSLLFGTDKHGRMPLHWAVIDNHPRVVEFLIAKGADINGKTGHGERPLHWAVRDGYMNVLELLVSKGANVNAESDDGNTPMHVAARWDRKDAAQLLFAKGADINAKNKEGATPLRVALSTQSTNVAEFLSQHGGHE